MKIHIEMDDKWALIIMIASTVIGAMVSLSLVYTTVWLQQGLDPMEQFRNLVPAFIYDPLNWVLKYSIYVGIVAGVILMSGLSIVIYLSNRRKKK